MPLYGKMWYSKNRKVVALLLRFYLFIILLALFVIFMPGMHPM